LTPERRRAARYAWALLMARIYEVFPLVCPLDGAEMRVIAFFTDPPTIHDILVHLREPTHHPGSRPPAAMRWGTRAMKQEKQNCRTAEIRLPCSRSRLRSIAMGAARFRRSRDNLPRGFCAWTPPLSKACAWKTGRRS
jgi:hypothetical protein